MKPIRVLFSFLFIFSYPIFSMEKSSDENTVLVDKAEDEILTKYYLDFQKQERRLSKGVLKDRSLDIPSYLSGIDFQKEIDHLFAKAFHDEAIDTRFIFVDFDGVLAELILIGKDGREYKYILNTPNCVIEPQLLRAHEFIASNTFVEARERAVTKLRSVGMEIADDPKEQVDAISRIMGALRLRMAEGEDTLGFTEKYGFVDEKLRIFLQEQKEKGAHLFVLSAKNVTEERAKFLLDAYGNIFAPNAQKDLLRMAGFKEIPYDPSCSYFFSENKGGVLALAPTFTESKTVEIAFFDDHLQRMSMTYAPIASRNLRGYLTNKISAVFVPYPMLAVKFNQNDFINDCFDIIEALDELSLRKLVKQSE